MLVAHIIGAQKMKIETWYNTKFSASSFIDLGSRTPKLNQIGIWKCFFTQQNKLSLDCCGRQVIVPGKTASQPGLCQASLLPFGSIRQEGKKFYLYRCIVQSNRLDTVSHLTKDGLSHGLRRKRMCLAVAMAFLDILLNKNQLRKEIPMKVQCVMSNNTCQQFLPCAWKS